MQHVVYRSGISYCVVPVVVTDISSPSPPCLLNGTTVTIQCVTSGFPRPQITFTKDSVALDVGTYSNFVQLDYDTLNITVVQRDDQGGNYSCSARDGDTVLSISAIKTLLFCSKCFGHCLFCEFPCTHGYTLLFSTALPTNLVLEVPSTLPGTSALTEGERNVVLVCSYTAIPTAMVHWEKNKEKIPSTWRRSVNNSQPGLSQLEIRILILTDDGEYTCVVQNIAGTKRVAKTLSVKG